MQNTMRQNKYIDIALWLVFLLGCLLRFMPGVLTGFPINDGGMLMAMIRDLRSSNFLLPFATSYNYSNIPFVYPPLGIYIAAILSQLSIPDLALLRWLPPLISAVAILAFFWLACRILGSKPKALIATALYAVLPGSYDWFIMGGGLTRSFSILFSLLTIGYTYRLFHDKGDKKILGLATLFCALVVLSHPEVGLQTVSICLLLWLLYGRNIPGMKNIILLGLGTALLTAWWWLTALLYHGFSPFESAIQTGIHETLLASFFHSFFSTQGGVPILPIFELIGIFVVLRKREPILVLWAFLPFFVDPRNAPAIVTFPFLMLAGEGLYYWYAEIMRVGLETFSGSKKSIPYLSVSVNGSFVAILFYLFFVSYTATSSLVHLSLSISDRETMKWVKENTPPGSRFLLLTNRGQISPMTDSYQEWFPALAERQSQNTLQGQEWILGSSFFEYSQRLIALQACPDTDCLNRWLAEENVEIDFVIAQKQRVSPGLMNSLRTNEHYHPVYETANTEIFTFQP